MNLDGTPEVGSIWIYRGSSLGRGLVHQIVFSEPHEIITVSTEHSWLGSKDDFIKEFQPVK